MKFNTKKILSLILLSIALVSCNEGLDGFIDSTETTLQETNWAKEYYEQLPNRSTRLGVQKGKSKGVAVRPGWKHTIKEQGSWYSFVETDLVTEEVFNFVLPENASRYQETGDGRYLISQTHFVFRKSPVMEDMFYMTIIPSADYLEKTKFEPFKKMSYMKRDKSFSGIILFHDQNGEFANGWKYKDGLVTEAIVKMDEEQRFTRKLNSDEDTIKMLMNDGYIMYYSEGGGYSYTMTTLGDDVVDFEVKTTKSYDIPYYSTSVNDSYSSNHDYGSYENTGGYGGSPTQDYGYSHVGGYASSGGSNSTNNTNQSGVIKLKLMKSYEELNCQLQSLQANTVYTSSKESGIIVLANGITIESDPMKSTLKSVSFPIDELNKKINDYRTKITLWLHAHPDKGGGAPTPSKNDWSRLNALLKPDLININDFAYGIATPMGDLVVTVQNITQAKNFIKKVFLNDGFDESVFNEDLKVYHKTLGGDYMTNYINYIKKESGVNDSGIDIYWRSKNTDGGLTAMDEWKVFK